LALKNQRVIVWPLNEEIAAMANFRAPVCMALALALALALAVTNSVALAQPSSTAIPVTVDNYNRDSDSARQSKVLYIRKHE
jgi:hypothetical protein